jgi:hypothetical protein
VASSVVYAVRRRVALCADDCICCGQRDPSIPRSDVPSAALESGSRDSLAGRTIPVGRVSLTRTGIPLVVHLLVSLGTVAETRLMLVGG